MAKKKAAEASTSGLPGTGAGRTRRKKPAGEPPPHQTDAPPPQVVPQPALTMPPNNGVTPPSPGTITWRIWEISNSISGQHGRPATRQEVVTAAMAESLNPATATTHYGNWSRYWGITPAPVAAAPAVPTPGPAESAPGAQEPPAAPILAHLPAMPPAQDTTAFGINVHAGTGYGSPEMGCYTDGTQAPGNWQPLPAPAGPPAFSQPPFEVLQDPRPMPTHAQAWEQGYTAYQEGYRRGRNPWERGSPTATSWDAGWVVAYGDDPNKEAVAY